MGLSVKRLPLSFRDNGVCLSKVKIRAGSTDYVIERGIAKVSRGTDDRRAVVRRNGTVLHEENKRARRDK